MLMIVYQVISSNLCNIRLQLGKDLTGSVSMEVGSKKQIKVSLANIEQRNRKRNVLKPGVRHEQNQYSK